jgi:hypothetical protein
VADETQDRPRLQFGALGACPVVPGGCPHPTGWRGHPNHRQLPREVPGTRDPTTARHIRCLRGAVVYKALQSRFCSARGSASGANSADVQRSTAPPSLM